MLTITSRGSPWQDKRRNGGGCFLPGCGWLQPQVQLRTLRMTHADRLLCCVLHHPIMCARLKDSRPALAHHDRQGHRPMISFLGLYNLFWILVIIIHQLRDVSTPSGNSKARLPCHFWSERDFSSIFFSRSVLLKTSTLFGLRLVDCGGSMFKSW